MKRLLCTLVIFTLLIFGSCAENGKNTTSVPEITIPPESYDLNEYTSNGVLEGKVIYKSPTSTIERTVFEGNAKITHLYIEDGVTAIAGGAFAGCTSLESIRLPATLTDLGMSKGNVFADCTSLKAIYIPEGVKTIDQETFLGCTALSVVSLPEGLNGINLSAFENCTSLTALKLPESLTFMGRRALINSGIKELVLPDGLDVTWPLNVETAYVTKDSPAHVSLAETDSSVRIVFKANTSKG